MHEQIHAVINLCMHSIQVQNAVQVAHFASSRVYPHILKCLGSVPVFLNPKNEQFGLTSSIWTHLMMNGFCDSQCNTAQCFYDDGDCGGVQYCRPFVDDTLMS